MLKREYRWRGRIGSDFFATAKRKKITGALLYYQLDPSLKQPQIAIIAPKKTFKRSTVRNQLKRQWAAKIQAEILPNLESGYYVLVITPP